MMYRAAQELVALEDHVDLRIELEWDYVARASLDAMTNQIVVPSELGGPGIYRLRSGRRDSGADFDCWYVGRTIRDVEGRVTFHASEDFDEDARCLKRLKSNIRESDG